MEKIPTQPRPEQLMPNSPEQIAVEQKQHEAMCTARFIGEYITGTGNLSLEREIFLVDYLRTHHGLWEKFDDQDVYLTQVKLEGNKLHFHFAQAIEGQPYNVQVEVIELPE